MGQKILLQRSCTSAPTVSCNRILIQVVQRILTQRSWNRDLDTEISHKCAYRILIQWAKRSCYRDLAQVLLEDPDTSGPKDHSHRDPETEILHKLSHRILIQRSRTSAPIGSWYSGSKDPAAEILYKCSYRIRNRDLAQVVPQDPDTEILHKWS